MEKEMFVKLKWLVEEKRKRRGNPSFFYFFKFMEEKKRLEIISIQEFKSWELFSKLNQEVLGVFSGLGEIIKGVRQDYSDGTTASYLLIKPNGLYPSNFNCEVCCKLPYNL